MKTRCESCQEHSTSAAFWRERGCKQAWCEDCLDLQTQYPGVGHTPYSHVAYPPRVTQADMEALRAIQADVARIRREDDARRERLGI